MNVIEGSGMWSLEVAINNSELNAELFSCWIQKLWIMPKYALRLLMSAHLSMKSDGLSVTEMLRVFEECE